MKKSFKSALSLLFVLIFVFQFACVGAYAGGSKAQLKLGFNSKEYDSGIVFYWEDFSKGFQIIPASGKYVTAVSINGISILKYGCYDKSGAISFTKGDLEDAKEEKNIQPDGKNFVVAFSDSELSSSAEVTIKSRVTPSEGTKVEYKDNTPIVLERDDSGNSVGRFHTQWVAEYANGVCEYLDADKTVNFKPFADCTVRAYYDCQYFIYYKIDANYKVYDGNTNISQNTYITKIEQDGSALLDISDFSVSGIDYSIADAAAGSGKAVTVDTSDAVVVYDEEELDEEDYVLIQDGGETYTIGKRNVTVKAEKVDAKYDGSIKTGKLSADGLVDGHKLASYKFENETCAPVSVKYKASQFKDIVIKDSADNDVTANYNILFDDTEADYIISSKDVDKIEITFAAKNVSTPYTGKPIEGQFQITEGDASKLEGIEVFPRYEYDSSEHTNVGKRNYKLTDITLKIGEYNVTSAFKVNISDSAAELNITAHKATLTILDASKEYDGTPLYADNCKIDGLLEGHRLDKASLVYTKPVEIGSGKSDIQAGSIKVLDAGDHDVTALYDITVVPGNLTVTKLKFTITAGSASKKFDGSTLKADNSYILSDADKAKLAKVGWHLDVVTQGSQKEIGSSDVTFKKIDVLKADNSVVDVKYYEYSTVTGTLTIEPDPMKPTIKITVESAKKVYDGTPLLLDPNAYAITENTLDDNNYSIEVKLGTASITNAGKKTVGAEVVTYTIRDKSNGNAVIEKPEKKFNIQIVPGTLEVTKYPIKVTAKSGSKTYDGKELVINSCTITAENNKLAKDSHVPTVTIEAQDGNGNKVQAIKVGKYYNVVTKVTIKDKDTNMDVTANYEITTVNGTLTIKNSNGNPQTGDNSNISLWATVLAVSAVAVVCVATIAVVKGKRKAK